MLKTAEQLGRCIANESLKLPEKRNSRPLGKVRGAYVKPGIAERAQDVHEAFARKLLTAGVPIMQRSSARIAKLIKREVEIETLK